MNDPELLSGDKDSGYRGKQNKSKSGKTCQLWSKQTPHEHANTPEEKPDSGLESNYCRNPDGGDTIWCYTTDPDVRWEYCEPLKSKLSEAIDILKDKGT